MGEHYARKLDPRKIVPIYGITVRTHACTLTMTLRKYLRPLNGLPDSSGSLSSRIPSAAIAEANRLVTGCLLILNIFLTPRHSGLMYYMY